MTPEYLRKVLKYDPETGNMFWLPRTPDLMKANAKYSKERVCATFNAVYAGKPAFTATMRDGHKYGNINRKSFLAHRVAWAIHYGEWPQNTIDHINGNSADNRLANLRSATQQQNCCNRRNPMPLESGIRGARWDKKCRRWFSVITSKGKQHFLGYYETAEQAHKAYIDAANLHHGEFAVHRSKGQGDR